MTTFSRTELRELAPGDLADLIAMADGTTPWECAMTLGLDPTNPNDRKAVEAAVSSRWDDPELSTPPIGAGQPGVRSDLTPVEQRPATPDTDQGAVPVDALGLPQGDPQGAAELAAAMQHSADTGEPFMAGTFALYADPSGSVVMIRTDQAGNRTDAIIPRRAVRFALALMSGQKIPGMGLLEKIVNRHG